MGKSAGTGQHGPRDTAAVLGARYWLTDKGEAVVAAIRWSCLELDCDDHGEGDKAAEKHTKATTHATTTSLSGRVAAGKKAT